MYIMGTLMGMVPAYS